jgi:hypothetical protein
MIAPLSHTTPLEPSVADAMRSCPPFRECILLSSIDVDCTDLDHILDNRQFDPCFLARETLAAEAKSSTQSQFVLDTSMPGLN